MLFESVVAPTNFYILMMYDTQKFDLKYFGREIYIEIKNDYCSLNC